jgi:hypothetical protein
LPKIPKPLDVTWELKPVDSAKSWVNELPDGRTQYFIEHELLRGVTPAMIVWYLNNLTDLISVGDETVQRYRMWHPRDHIMLTYMKPGTDGRNFGPGAVVRIQEAFQANPKYGMDIRANVEFLDETGFAHYEKMVGMQVARLDYKFTQTPEGTLYENVLTVGREGRGPLARLINRVIAPRVFPREKGLAWIQHNIEEVGAFPSFLPEMYDRDARS